MHRLLLFLLVAAPALAAQTRAAAPAPANQSEAPFIATRLGKGTIAVDGPWAFHAGDNPAWASPQFDDGKWTHIAADRSWELQGFRDLTGFGWYRRRIVLEPAPDGDPGWQLAIALAGVQTAAEVYWNGNRVGSYGKLPPDPVWYGSPPLSGFAARAAVMRLGRPQSGVLAIRVWQAPHVFFNFPVEGGLVSPPLLGSEQALATHVSAEWYEGLSSRLCVLGMALLSSVVALLALLAWLRNRGQRMLLWLALYTSHPVAMLPIVLPGLLSFRWNYGLIAPIVCIGDVSLWYLLLWLLDLRGNPRLLRWTWWMAVIAVVGNFGDGALQLFNWTTWPDHLFLTLDIGFTIPSLLVEAWPVVLVVFAFRRRLDAARWFLAIVAMLADLNQAVGYWLFAGYRWTHLTIGRWFAQPLFSILGNPFDAQTILNTLLLVAIVYAVWRYLSEQTRRQTHLDEEFRNAQELQRMLVPESLPEIAGYIVSSAYRPAQEVGGDFFQVIPPRSAKGPALLVVGDVSGKGLKAAMTVSLIVGTLRTLADITTDPAEVLGGLNHRLHERLRGGFATCLVARLEVDGACLIANAGHLPPYCNGHEVPVPPSLPLGIGADSESSIVSLALAPGDTLTLLTDGVVEARNTAGELFGFDRTAAISNQSAEAIATAAQRHGQDDDITVLTLTRLGRDAQSATQLSAPLLVPA
jgi:hypothetical protein